VTPLLAVDGHHLLYRSWWGFSDRRILSRDKSRDLTAVFGFIAILRKTHLDITPDHEVVVVFDGESAATGRQSSDPEYKANRRGVDHTAIKSLGMVKDALAAVGITWIELDYHEADDVIATLTHTATMAGRRVTCYSGDRDFLQLLDHPWVSIINPARRRVTAAEVTSRYGVAARQWPDYRALTGDPSDNIPGVPGVGPKTAARLLAGGLHLEQLHATPWLQTARWRAVASHWDRLFVWRDMIRTRTDLMLPADLLSAMPTPRLSRAAEVLERLGLW
jgi:5'-3' exonuclease